MRALSHRFSFVTVAAVVTLALSVTACSVGPGEITGGFGGNEPGWQSPDSNGTGEPDADDDSSGDADSAKALAVGTIEVKVERAGASPRMFTLEASECEVSVDR